MADESEAEDLSVLQLEELKTLCQNTPVLKGRWESSAEGIEMHNRRISLAKEICSRAETLQRSDREVAKLRAEYAEQSSRLQSTLQQWKEAELMMLRSIEPYSQVGIERQILQTVNKYDEDSRLLEQNQSDVISQLEKFRKLRSEYHVNLAVATGLR